MIENWFMLLVGEVKMDWTSKAWSTVCSCAPHSQAEE